MAGKPGQKSALTTEVGPRFSEDFLEAMDGRGVIVRTLRQRLGQLTADLGGLAQLSYQERSLCRRIVHLERMIEKRELVLARGGTVDENVYLTSLNTLSGLFGKIGFQRRPKMIQDLAKQIQLERRADAE